MTIYNMGDGGKLGQGYSHPVHIHGTHFYVMKIGYPEYYPENMTIKAMNPDIPCFNDTVSFLILKHLTTFKETMC